MQVLKHKILSWIHKHNTKIFVTGICGMLTTWALSYSGYYLISEIIRWTVFYPAWVLMGVSMVDTFYIKYKYRERK